jgi:predicted permease
MHALIAVQVAFCFVVQFGAGLFVASFERIAHQPTGFSAERILNLESVTSRPQSPVFWNQVVDHLRSTPGVEAAALTVWPIMSGESGVSFIATSGSEPTEVFSDFLRIGPGWIDLMKIPFVDGRDFRAGENAPGVAIVNQAFAKQFFNGEDPVGKPFDRVDAGVHTRYEVVGLVRDARSRDDLRIPIRPTAYIPFPAVDAAGALQPSGRGTFVVRTASANPLALASMLRREVAAARPEFHVNNIRAQAEINLAHALRERLLAVLALFFAGVALLLGGIGLYGVLDYSVLQRRREIGIRLAIGAQTGDIALRVTADAFRMVLAGALSGLFLGMVLVRYVESLLFQVKPGDAAMLALPSFTILAAAMIAALPAVFHAVRIDPVSMLRSE